MVCAGTDAGPLADLQADPVALPVGAPDADHHRDPASDHIVDTFAVHSYSSSSGRVAHAVVGHNAGQEQQVASIPLYSVQTESPVVRTEQKADQIPVVVDAALSHLWLVASEK